VRPALSRPASAPSRITLREQPGKRKVAERRSAPPGVNPQRFLALLMADRCPSSHLDMPTTTLPRAGGNSIRPRTRQDLWLFPINGTRHPPAVDRLFAKAEEGTLDLLARHPISVSFPCGRKAARRLNLALGLSNQAILTLEVYCRRKPLSRTTVRTQRQAPPGRPAVCRVIPPGCG
jgi:hypothetical protein